MNLEAEEGLDEDTAKEERGRRDWKYESTPEPMPPVAPVTRYLRVIMKWYCGSDE